MNEILDSQPKGFVGNEEELQKLEEEILNLSSPPHFSDTFFGNLQMKVYSVKRARRYEQLMKRSGMSFGEINSWAQARDAERTMIR